MFITLYKKLYIICLQESWHYKASKEVRDEWIGHSVFDAIFWDQTLPMMAVHITLFCSGLGTKDYSMKIFKGETVFQMISVCTLRVPTVIRDAELAHEVTRRSGGSCSSALHLGRVDADA